MMEILYLVLIGFTAGIVKGTSGFGSSLVAIPLLLWVGFIPDEAVTMMITSNIILNVLLIRENKDYFHMETIKKIYPIILGGVLFTAAGLYVVNNVSINPYVVEVIAGLLIIVAIINSLVKVKLSIKENFVSLFSVGILSGFGNGLASIDGPPVVFYLKSIDAPMQRFKSTLAVHFFIMGIVGVVLLFFNGNYDSSILLSTLYLFISLVVGLVIGMIAGRKLDEEMFKKVVLVVLIGLAVSLFIP